jgi:hypothetical protein
LRFQAQIGRTARLAPLGRFSFDAAAQLGERESFHLRFGGRFWRYGDNLYAGLDIDGRNTDLGTCLTELEKNLPACPHIKISRFCRVRR